MKGTFFSADFVRDENDNLRLIEINTDTGIVESQKSVFDWTDFFNILSENNINELEVLFKESVQAPIISSLTEYISLNQTSITTFNPIMVPEDSIFPSTPMDSDNKFILRMAYDETAILDSEYAKGTLNLLKLFVDNEEGNSVVNFYHSSSLQGVYNTLDDSIFTPQNMPDLISKTLIEEHVAHTFYKIGKSDLSLPERIEGFINENQASDLVFEQYHYSPDSLIDNSNHVSSIRTFHVVYGSNLDLCTVAEYEVMSVFELPTTIEFNNEIISNEIPSKHYYEFATNHVKNLRHGFLGDTEILDANNEGVEIRNAVIGDTFKSYFIENAPNTDDTMVINSWKFSGSTLPSGSYETTSTLVDVYTDETYTNEMTIITFGDEELIVGGETRLLTYDSFFDVIEYVRVLDLNTGDKIIKTTGEFVDITKIETAIFEEPQTVYALNLEDVDSFILKVQNIHGFSLGSFFGIAHNCFVAGTKVQMEDGTEKNIEEIVVGDKVVSYNEELKQNEIKEVLSCTKNTNKKLVKYHFSNHTSIVATPEHPFYIDGLKLASLNPESTKQIHGITVDVEEIKVGDLVYVSNGVSRTAIKEIEILDVEDTDTFIFTVKDNHNFYANNVLVHNK
jgi:hypothetical protein